MPEFTRDIYAELDAWAGSSDHRPLVLRGARQVGKTHALKLLGRKRFDSFSYINLFDGGARNALMEADSVHMLLDSAEAFNGVHVRPGTTLLCIDEVQEIPRLLTLLKAFHEEMPELHVAVAGSYLGMAQHAGLSFPVGSVMSIDVHPMTFIEFLDAVGDGAIARRIRDGRVDTLTLFEERLERRVRQYCFTGGMPAVVSAFVADGYQAARNVQRELLSNYDMDFSKHPRTGVDGEKVRLVFSSIPSHLSRENHKFIFGHIARGARAAQYESAIQQIVDSGLATRVYRVEKPVAPLPSYRDDSAFKLYMHDVGILAATLDLTPADVILGNDGFLEFRGALTEQYVCQQLVASGVTPMYWSNSNSTGEVDFVFSANGSVIPLEAKAGTERNKRSLKWLCDKYAIRGYRTSMRGYKEQDWLTNVPLWMVGQYFKRQPADAYSPDGGADLGPLPTIAE
ncbi:hypothetical protein CSQ85_03970 [Bifidobacterium rousetti]|uniref:ATP-binding protein n=1 Tax=Bifidobacterium rousetti TaxID=2045439 RepID=UPI00123C0848|nr:ATP-binding protein [Bifidobacterium rousetti]KAA8819855.1 hypothetical protein CSQ85_03970 [Bifidobacterium rousetti]